MVTATEELGFDEYIAYADRYDSGDLAECIKRQLNMAEENVASRPSWHNKLTHGVSY